MRWTSNGSSKAGATNGVLDPARCAIAYDSAYDEIVREHLAAFPLEDGFTEKVTKQFKRGALRPCSAIIGSWVDGQIGQTGLTQQELAIRLGVERSTVAKWTSDHPITLE